MTARGWFFIRLLIIWAWLVSSGDAARDLLASVGHDWAEMTRRGHTAWSKR